MNNLCSYPGPLVVCVCMCTICVCVCVCACVSVRETGISGWAYVSVRVGGWEVVIWCMGVGVKAGRMRTIILVPSIYYTIYSLLIILMCYTVYFIAHFSFSVPVNILSNNVHDISIVVVLS